MIPLKYISLDGELRVVALDSVVDVVRGPSGKRQGWRALVTYAPDEKVFIELRDAPPDVRGNSRSEAEEVGVSYVEATFGMTAAQIAQVVDKPRDWMLLEQ